MKSKIISIFSSIGALISGCFGGACGIACLAGGCCGSFAIFGVIGISGSSLAFMQKLTPVFLIITIASLAYAFWVVYKPKPKTCCSPVEEPCNQSSCCSKPKKVSFIKSKSFLWITTIICVVMWTYPLLKNTTNDSDSCCDINNNSNAQTCCLSSSANTTHCCSDFPYPLRLRTNSALQVCCPN